MTRCDLGNPQGSCSGKAKLNPYGLGSWQQFRCLLIKCQLPRWMWITTQGGLIQQSITCKRRFIPSCHYYVSYCNNTTLRNYVFFLRTGVDTDNYLDSTDNNNYLDSTSTNVYISVVHLVLRSLHEVSGH